MSDKITFESTGNLRRDVSIKMGVITRQFGKQFDQLVRELGVTRSQWGLIAFAARHPGSTQRTIADAMEVSEASVGRVIERLCASGLLERRQCTEDARAHLIYMTDAAQPMLQKLTEAADVSEEISFDGIEADDIEELNRILDKIYDNVVTRNKICGS